MNESLCTLLYYKNFPLLYDGNFMLELSVVVLYENTEIF